MEERTAKGQAADKSAAASDKSKALAAALSQIEKQFGKGSIMRLGAGEDLRPFRARLASLWGG